MAFIIDMALLFFFALALLFYATGLVFMAAPENADRWIVGLGTVLFFSPGMFLISGGVYFTLLHSWGGKTLGKLFMGIKVENRTGQDISLGVSFLRLAGYCLSLFPVGLGFLWAVLDKDHLAWHEDRKAWRIRDDEGGRDHILLADQLIQCRIIQIHVVTGGFIVSQEEG